MSALNLAKNAGKNSGKKTGLVAGAAAAMMMTSMAVAEAQTPPVPFEGPYLAVFIGIGDVNTSGLLGLSGTTASLNFSDTEFLGGLLVGWNFVDGPWRFGIESDVSFTDWEDSFTAFGETATFEADTLWTIRARAGVVSGNLLAFITGGLAILEGDISENATPASKNITAVGGVIGAGLEYLFSQNFSGRADVMYYFFDDRTGLANFGFASPGDHIEVEDAVVGRLVLTWHFGPL